MSKNEVIQMFKDKVMSGEWHWLGYHFSPYKEGNEHFLTASIIDSCIEIERAIPGFSEEFAEKLASYSGREKYLPHYEQIIQLLSELYVIRHLVSIPFVEPKFEIDPTIGDSKKNPEIGIKLTDKEILVEVKCREYIRHHNNRGNAAIEIPSRQDGVLDLANSIKKDSESLVLPRDNAIKDFLVSADEKFASFKENNPNAITILVIIWDDFIYEPISALLNDASGLLTENSFYKNGDVAHQFNNIEAVLVVRQSHNISRATRGELPVDGLKNPLDWGAIGQVLPKALISVNSTEELNGYLCEILQAQDIRELQSAADYRPQQFVLRV